jgi:hypothetical protein
MIAFMSDWGNSYYVGVAKSVIKQINPSADIIDITHHAGPFDSRKACYILSRAAKNFPDGTVFLCVVDAGVGTERKPIILETRNGSKFIGPDNGLFTLIARDFGIKQIRVIENPELFYKNPPSTTFHGRDIFAAAAGHLSAGVPLENFGRELDHMIFLNIREAFIDDKGSIRGETAFVDDFGNIATNVHRTLIEKAGFKKFEELELKVFGKFAKVKLVDVFGEVKKGELLAHIDSSEFLEIAINCGNASKALNVSGGEEITISRLS